jgi:hypothetical protein
MELEVHELFDIVDASGERLAFRTELMIVSPLTLKKRWTKLAIIRLFNESQNARHIGGPIPGNVPIRKDVNTNHRRRDGAGCRGQAEERALNLRYTSANWRRRTE